MADIRDIVVKAIVDAAVPNAGSLRDDVSLTDQGVDSLGVFTVVMNIQDACEIEIPDGDLDRLKTINDFVEYLAGRLS
ncbi:phosphopantetheine-binding protein [Pseudomonas sp. REP124]|uniref:acyl carrier protein n=1 Tax=Pseudomonas sp. REP124 TaxID=2875731 RepID=UPI001CCAFEFC|nr:phosphopantetheine-binding protein [Pseudomonas sp. REP124]MBZ9784461.1 phosphopantetheine-binding protein [Pseudomonas sp. REP124]